MSNILTFPGRSTAPADALRNPSFPPENVAEVGVRFAVPTLHRQTRRRSAASMHILPLPSYELILSAPEADLVRVVRLDRAPHGNDQAQRHPAAATTRPGPCRGPRRLPHQGRRQASSLAASTPPSGSVAAGKAPGPIGSGGCQLATAHLQAPPVACRRSPSERLASYCTRHGISFD